ncbi:uncharacterized protein LOC128557564 [Mercenaria mercenaria]|uniref:uncharacterized protein LOC128557564 n=1 Tax=Mercenaria mercenaria TaxID=6596 RepID=UPI00234E3CD2|nr:uncharacterized protein LOC128557564 [Mercenaria mercenaria]
MFCKNHDEVVCATCVAITHRDSCQNIHSIPDEVDNLYKQSASDQTKNQLLAAKKKNKTKQVEDKKKATQQIQNELKKQKLRAADSIINYRKELEAELKILETESLKDVDVQYNSMERDLQSEIKEAEEDIEDLEQSASKLRRSIENKAQEFALRQAPTAEATCKPKTTAYKVKQQRNINTKVKEDKYTCRILGSCFTEDGSLLLADNNNYKLKRLNISTYTIIDQLDLETGPDTVAAVSLRNNTIQFVSLGDKMITTRKLKMDHYCYGLAFNDGELFISDSDKTVYIHDIRDKMLHKVITKKSGTAIFSGNRHLNVSNYRDFVYGADSVKCLIILNKQGNYLSTFTDPDLVQPWGVCTDKRGNILVCGYISSNIVQISEDSKTKIGMIKTDHYPLSVSFNPHQNKLAVTHSNNNTVKVYELE